MMNTERLDQSNTYSASVTPCPPSLPSSQTSTVPTSSSLSKDKSSQVTTVIPTETLKIVSSLPIQQRDIDKKSASDVSQSKPSVKLVCTSTSANVDKLTSDIQNSTTDLIVKELNNFDPSTPEPEPSLINNSSNSLNQTSKSKEAGVVTSLAQYMEHHAIHPVIKSFLVGSVSGTCSTILFQPLDLLKTRLQAPIIRHGAQTIRSATAATTAGSNGLFTVVGHIVRDEKLLGLWKGMTPSLTRCVPGVGLYFASIHGLKLAFNINGEPSAVQSVLLGVTGRSISGVMMIPFTVIKTRFESTVYHYGSIREALFSIYRKEGVRGLTCGLLPTLLRDAPFSGLYLLMYTSTKKSVPREWIESTTFGPYVRFSCGVVAGVAASLITQPADVIKTKMQLYPDKFQSVPQVVAYVYKVIYTSSSLEITHYY
ncbi:Solute carrier family 25 member 38 [Orchesella cincta]|uniref:Solute carrier family 25 member 38 n=1 Tax=Orchesella cincta TaxID=48709 RepID=A0A1D2MP67_ORCCI|nr:Solute carrier family 25 member 38 [Orchesella cincta]